MKFIIETNLPGFFNDIADEIRLFYGKVLISLDDGTEIADPGEKVSVFCDIGENIVCRSSCGEYAYTENAILEDPSNEIIRKKNIRKCIKKSVFRLFKQFNASDTPWGSLTGVRPTKLYRELYTRFGEDRASMIFHTEYDVSDEKTELAKEIMKAQGPFLHKAGQHRADLYINIPFCVSKCLYCSFPSKILPIHSPALNGYLDVLLEELNECMRMVRENHVSIGAVYIGGGTPSILSEEQMTRLLSYLNESVSLNGIEFTVEAGRPDTLSYGLLKVLKNHNVSRLSINPQTMNDRTLAQMNRLHTGEDIAEAFRMCREIGFDSINMDLIAGLPGEELEDFRDSIEKVIALEPDNITVHALTLKKSAALFQSGSMCDENIIKEMTELGYEKCREAVYIPYYMYRQKYISGNLENIGYAKQDKICQYNIDMMEETTNILANGACSVSKFLYSGENRIERVFNPKDIHTYYEKIGQTILEKENRLKESLSSKA